MRRIAVFALGIASSFGLFAMAAPAANAQTDSVFAVIPDQAPAVQGPILTVCLTVRAINSGPNCLVI